MSRIVKTAILIGFLVYIVGVAANAFLYWHPLKFNIADWTGPGRGLWLFLTVGLTWVRLGFIEQEKNNGNPTN